MNLYSWKFFFLKNRFEFTKIRVRVNTSIVYIIFLSINLSLRETIDIDVKKYYKITKITKSIFIILLMTFNVNIFKSFIHIYLFPIILRYCKIFLINDVFLTKALYYKTQLCKFSWKCPMKRKTNVLQYK